MLYLLYTSGLSLFYASILVAVSYILRVSLKADLVKMYVQEMWGHATGSTGIIICSSIVLSMVLTL